MKFLVYTVESKNKNLTLGGFKPGTDEDLARIIVQLRKMNLERLINNDTVSILVKNIKTDRSQNIVTAELYKQTNPGKALLQMSEGEEGVTFQNIISEDEDAFIKGFLGLKKTDSGIYMFIESDFGSYFVTSSKGLKFRSLYSSESIQSIQDSETIGDTVLDFADDADLTASLFKPPEDEDLREEKGFGSTNIANKIASLVKLSKSHNISLDIDRNTWLDNVEVFNELIESPFINRIRIKGTVDGVVRLGEGGEKAIRESITTTATEMPAIKKEFKDYSP